MAERSRLKARDLVDLASLGARMHRLRAALSALGVSIGIAAIVSVIGITESSQSDLLAQIDRLGTNLLTVENGRTLGGAEARLPTEAPAMIGHMPAVEHVSATALLTHPVYRTDKVPAFETGGIGVRAVDPQLLTTLDGALVEGSFLTAATSRYPTAVLGSGAAVYLGIDRLEAQPRVWIDGRWFVVIGIIRSLALAPEIDQSVMVGWPVAEADLGFDGYPTRIYVRAQTDRVTAVDTLLAATADPQNPEQVSVSRPSDALAARIEVANSGTTLLLGLGAVALLVGGVGVANVMFVSVLERRSEIGLRRALGATPTHIALQFLGEAALLTSCGAGLGLLAGVTATSLYSNAQGWSILIPAFILWTTPIVALVVGGLAGLYPALRAARLAPADSLRAG